MRWICMGVLAGCNLSTGANLGEFEDLELSDLEAAKTAAGAARMIYESSLDPPMKIEGLPYAPHWFRVTNREEILKTIEFVRVAEEGPFAAVYARYSIGTTICRDVLKLQNVGGLWMRAHFPYVSEYTPLEHNLHQDHEEFFVKVAKDEKEWTKEQPACWW